MPPEPSRAPSHWILLHKLWMKAALRADYDKDEWMALERAIAALVSLVRRAATDLVEPMGISHLTKDTEWRAVAEAWLAEAVPLAFGSEEAVFGRRPPGMPEERGEATFDLRRAAAAGSIPEGTVWTGETRADPAVLADVLVGRMPGDAERAALREGLEAAVAAIDRDRSGMAKALSAIKKEVQGRSWITEGRGPYAWDDERYKEEAGAALRAVLVLADDALLASGRLADVEFKKAKAALAGSPAREASKLIRIDLEPGKDYEVHVGAPGERTMFGVAGVTAGNDRMTRERAATVEEILGRDRYSTEEVLQVLRNVGVDVECGACACVAFTGHDAYDHTCGKKTSRVAVTSGPVPGAGSCGAETTLRDEQHALCRCALPAGHTGPHRDPRAGPDGDHVAEWTDASTSFEPGEP